VRISKWSLYFVRIVDVLLAVSALFLAGIIVGVDIFAKDLSMLFVLGVAVQAIAYLVSLYVLNIYTIIWYYATLQEIIRLIISVVFSQMISFAIHLSVGRAFSETLRGDEYLKLHITSCMIAMVFIVSLRALLYIYEKKSKRVVRRSQDKNTNTMVIGAGDACNMFVFEMGAKHGNEYTVKCIIDDDPMKHGMRFGNIPVVGDRYSIEAMAKEYKIKKIIFAIPSCKAKDKAEILKICAKTKCDVLTMPSIYQMVGSGANKNEGVNNIRKVEIEDLLGREPIRLDLEPVMSYVSGKVVLVTGGGGSIGSELCRQIAAYKPKTLIIFDIYENNAYDIQLELKRKYPTLDIVTLIGSVRDNKRIDMLFEKYRPEIVYHAAAHKHVPLMEDSPNEAIKNNVFGTLNVVQMADKFKVKKFILISTDKAVNPTNIMGASKRICEMIVQSFNRYSETEFAAVRFGNVLGSNGSVIPIFKRQIEEGGPITVTHPDIIRFFMTIPEAVSLVLQAGASAKGGEIFVLDMGQPVKILDLAENIIKLSGLEPYKDIDIKFTGLRPGEKLYEELLMSEEGLKATENSLIHIGKPIEIDEEFFFGTLHNMRKCMADDTADIRGLVKEIVPTYVYKEK